MPNETNGYFKVKDKNGAIQIIYPITKAKNVQGLPQTAEVGQVLSVKAVDENGKPTEWECIKQSGGGEGEKNYKADFGTTEILETDNSKSRLITWDVSDFPITVNKQPYTKNICNTKSVSYTFPSTAKVGDYVDIPLSEYISDWDYTSKNIYISFNVKFVSFGGASYPSSYYSFEVIVDGQKNPVNVTKVGSSGNLSNECNVGLVAGVNMVLRVSVKTTLKSDYYKANLTSMQIEFGEEKTDYTPYIPPETIVIDGNTPMAISQAETEGQYDTYKFDKPVKLVNFTSDEKEIGTWVDGRRIYTRSALFVYQEMNASQILNFYSNIQLVGIQIKKKTGNTYIDTFVNASRFRFDETNGFSYNIGIATTNTDIAVVRYEYIKPSEKPSDFFDIFDL